MESWDLSLVASDNETVLPPKVAHDVRSFLSTALDIVKSLEQDIARTECMLTELRARRVQEISRIQAYQLAIAPHRKLPNEILALIFYHAAAIPFVALWSNTQTQSIISQVCKKWRDISYGTPALWSDIVWGGGYSLMNNSKLLKTVEVALSRTASSPVVLNIKSRPGPLQASISSRILSLRAPQLRSLTMDRCTAPGFGPFLKLPRGSVDNLEYIDLEFEQGREWEGVYISVFQDAPNIRNVKLALPRDFNPCSLNLPWEKLTDLSFPTATGSANSPRVDAILRQGTSLVNLTLDIRESEVLDPVEGQGKIILPHLQSFALNLHSYQSNLLDYLVMPNLTKIVLNNCNKVAWQPGYTTHLIQSGTMQTISIDIPIPTSAIDAILLHNHHLIELRLPSSDLFSTHSLTSMSFGELVPDLRILECYIPKDGPAGLGAHLDMVQSRREMGVLVCSDIPTLEFKLRSRLEWLEDLGVGTGVVTRGSVRDGELVVRVKNLKADGWSIRFR
ncbi:hypothetical protein BDZ94DRAFT_1272682 [Collybia nuda]|uniref:F-box domain-containing protein n=1 Tax=Collybia nuda TaxID=64659 RepID=A0A9P5XTW0_9AGAR|nr:hypothetical protein BDZ94DRAFT_1272682 [Collybia nuda]